MQQNLRLNYIYFFPPTTIRIPKMQISSIIEISRLMNTYSQLLLWAQFFKIKLLSASLTKFRINFKKIKCSKIKKDSGNSLFFVQLLWLIFSTEADVSRIRKEIWKNSKAIRFIWSEFFFSAVRFYCKKLPSSSAKSFCYWLIIIKKYHLTSLWQCLSLS